MKVIIDLLEDMREHIKNAPDYSILSVLLKEDEQGEMQRVGEKPVKSVRLDETNKTLVFGFLEEGVVSQTLIEMINKLPNEAMMYEVVLEISSEHERMPIIGFGENHDEKQFALFVQA